MAKKKEVQVPQVEEVTQENETLDCELIVGMKNNGEVYLFTRGDMSNLIVVDGLIKYAQRELNRLWAKKTGQEE